MDATMANAAAQSTQAHSQQTLSEQLARFVLRTSYGSIPAPVIDQAKGHFLDVLGIAIASSGFDFGRSVLSAGIAMGKGSDAHALASGAGLPEIGAALVNGTLAHGLDFDDTHIGAIYHASAPAFAAALAAGETVVATGQNVFLAYLLGLEIGSRLARGAAGALHERGFHPTGLCGTFAAAAVGARLHQDTEAQLVSALGLCGSQAAGVLELRESWLKRLHPGWAAHSGLAAGILSRHGFQGPRTMLEGPQGFYMAHVGKLPTAEQSPVAGLGTQWEIEGLALKPYPCCHFLHAFVDAALALREEVDIDEIERIDFYVSPALLKMGAPIERAIRPATIYDALFSVHYTVALALVKGRVDLAAFYSEPLNDPAVTRIAEKVVAHEDPLSDFPRHFPGEVHITLKDGRTVKRREFTSTGTPERRLSREAINEKFLANATRVLSRSQAERAMAMVWDIEHLTDIHQLIAACTISSGDSK